MSGTSAGWSALVPITLGRLAAFCARNAWLVLVLAALIGGASDWAVTTRLGVSTDTGKLFSASLPWKRRGAEIQRAFPQGEDTLAVVIDGRIPEEADVTADGLVAALAGNPHILSIDRPDAAPYLERNAFLFLDVPELTSLLNHTIDAQPFLGKLNADPTLRGLFGALSLIAEGVARGDANLGPFLPALAGFHTSLAAAAAGHPQPLSWERLLAGSLADQAGRYRFVIVKPKLDFGALQPGATGTTVVRRAIARLPFVRQHLARVRITGSIALDDEEFASVAQGALKGLVVSTLLVILWLFLAVRSWRLIVPILITLFLGLLLTAGFAAIAVGTLNLVSVAFAVLFVGIAVDFAIQFSVRMREQRLLHPQIADALRTTGRRAGVQILVAASATASGFLAFTPTAFVGVAQLGLIAGVGMLLAFCCTLTVLPAALAIFRPHGEQEEVGLSWLHPLDGLVTRFRITLLGLFALLALAAIALLPRLAFDNDPLHTKNPNTEAMRTLTDLIDDPVTNPYTMEVLVRGQPQADALATQLRALRLVDSVLSLSSFVPENQAAKLPLIEDAADLLLPGLIPPPTVPPIDAAALRHATAALADALAPILPRLPPGHPLALIAADLARLRTAPDALLLATNTAMVEFLPLQLDRLRMALSAKPVTVADVPASISRDWTIPGDRYRLQIVPGPSVRGTAMLHQFVAEVSSVAPDAAGSASTIVRSADTIVVAFRSAAEYALLAITVILFLALRRLRDVALVLTSLLMSTLLTVLGSVLLPLPLNFANVIALPLLLGVGVSFNIYFVMNWRAGRRDPLASATARAVLFSALTTATAFGSLALSRHPGTASMGKLLLLSLASTVVSTFLLLPALLASLRPGRGLFSHQAEARRGALPLDPIKGEAFKIH